MTSAAPDPVPPSRPTPPARATLETAEAAARRMGVAISKHVPPGWRFVLVLASSGAQGASTYIASIERESAVALLEELTARIRTDDGLTVNVERCWCCQAREHLTELHGPTRHVTICRICLATQRALPAAR